MQNAAATLIQGWCFSSITAKLVILLGGRMSEDAIQACLMTSEVLASTSNYTTIRVHRPVSEEHRKTIAEHLSQKHGVGVPLRTSYNTQVVRLSRGQPRLSAYTSIAAHILRHKGSDRMNGRRGWSLVIMSESSRM